MVRGGRASGAEDVRPRPWDELPVAKVPDATCEPCQDAHTHPLVVG